MDFTDGKGCVEQLRIFKSDIGMNVINIFVAFILKRRKDGKKEPVEGLRSWLVHARAGIDKVGLCLRKRHTLNIV